MPYGLKEVSEQQLAARLGKIGTVLYTLMQNTIMPIGIISGLIFLLMFLLGQGFSHKTLRKYGLGGMVTVLIVTVIWFAFPTVIGFFKYLGGILNGN